MNGNPFLQKGTVNTRKNTAPARNSPRPAGTGSIGSGIQGKMTGNGVVQSAASDSIENSPIYSSEIGKEAKPFRFDRNELTKGLIYSEILGPPKSKRTGR